MVRVRSLVLAAALAVLFAGAAAPTADAKPRPTCKKPRGLVAGFRSAGAVLLWDLGRQANQRWYLCTAKTKRPRLFYDARSRRGLDTSQETFLRTGNRIAFAWLLDTSAGGRWEVGWVDATNAKRRVLGVRGALQIEGVAVGPGGSIAYVDGFPSYTQTIGYAAPRGKARFLIDVREGRVDPKSLQLGAETLIWRTTSGAPRIASLGYTPREWDFMREFALPTRGSRPREMATGPDGAVWFTEEAGNRIGRIAPDGQIGEFALPSPNSRPAAITAGPDGALWFTEQSANKIGRISSAGAITELSVLTPDSGPSAIAAGPDGALWFTESRAKQIGRVTAEGAITEYKPAGASASLGAITAGPDGAIWFVALGARGSSSRIQRMTTDGAVTAEFGLKGAPADLVAGPDGGVWFTRPGGDAIGRLARDGKITEYRVRSFRGSPAGITAGPDGALWFTEQAVDKIGRITTTGTLEEYRVPTEGAAPTGIAAGADGALWFSEYGTNRIGRITPAVAG